MLMAHPRLRKEEHRMRKGNSLRARKGEKEEKLGFGGVQTE